MLSEYIKPAFSFLGELILLQAQHLKNSDTVGFLFFQFAVHQLKKKEIQRPHELFFYVLLWHTQHVTIFIGYVLGKEDICFLVWNNFFVSSAKNISFSQEEEPQILRSCFTEQKQRGWWGSGTRQHDKSVFSAFLKGKWTHVVRMLHPVGVNTGHSELWWWGPCA